MPDEHYDVFVSYGPDDADRAERLAVGLRSAGFTVFHDKWEILPGDRIVTKLDSGIRSARHGIVVISKQSIAHPWANEKYAALATRAMDGKLERLLPVLLDHGVELPPILGSRAPFSFVDVYDQDTFCARVGRLAAELRGTRLPGPVELVLGVEPDDARLRDTPAQTTIRIDATSTVLIRENGTEERADHAGVTGDVRHALWAAERARRGVDRTMRALPTDQPRPSSGHQPDLHDANREVGTQLTQAFLPEPVGTALAVTLAAVRRSGRITHLAFEFPAARDDLADLPWESLVLPGEPTPVSLDPSVRVYRHVAGLGATTVRSIPGPLRILTVIASPDVGDHELLDYEYELASILDQVQNVRAEQHAHVRILNWGSLDAVRDALRDEDFHVLHVSCHATEGLLYLEKPDGTADQVDAGRFATELRFPQNMPPLVVLAGCRTGLAGDATDSATPLPAYARELISRGVPSVIAMNMDVSDEYATMLLSRTYRELAAHRDGPEALHAISAARQLVERQRTSLPKDDPAWMLAEWTAAALYQRVRHNLLFDPAAPTVPVPVTRRTMLPRAIVDLDVGDFVGRRSELRSLRRELTAPGGRSRGVLIHGMGGVGKSSLATQLVRMLGERAVIVAEHGPHTVDQLLNKLVDTVRRRFDRRRGTDQDLDDVADESMPWQDRLALLDEQVLPSLGRVDVVLLLDDPLGDPLEVGSEPWPPDRAELEPGVTAFLQMWLTLRGTKLVVTSRVRLGLADDRRMVAHHLGPLSLAESRKLVFRLPAIDALSVADQRRAFQAVGGHPRALEYLDAVLTGDHRRAARRGSDNRFDVIVERMDRTLAKRGRDTASLRVAGAELAAAVDETVALVSSDVLLDELFTGLSATFKSACALLVAVSVHRQPIDETGLRWSAGEQASDPARLARLDAAYQALLAAERDDTARSRADLDLPRETHEQLNRDLAVATLSPTPSWLPEARDRLERLTLLTPIPPAADAAEDDRAVRYLVHRWTARSLADMVDASELEAAHRRAAGYHRWRAHLWRAVPEVHLRELEEVRYHCTEAREQEQVLAVTAEICAVLDLRGANAWESELCDQVLKELAGNDVRGRVFRHRKSVVSMRRGDYDEAELLQQQAQELAKAADDKVAVAVGLQQLGTIAHLRGDTATAEARYREAVRAAGAEEIRDRLDARIVLAGCYQRLGGIALGRSDEEEAERFSIGAAEVAEEIGNETSIATIHRDLAELARALGDQVAADAHEVRARAAAAAYDDVRRLLAAASLQLGAVYLTRHMFNEALGWLGAAWELARQVGDLPLLAACEQLRGETQVNIGDLGAARITYQRFVELADDLGDGRGIVVAYQQLGRIASMLGEPKVALAELRTAMTTAKKIRADALVAATHLVLGGILVANGRSDEAATEFGEGLRLADTLGQDGLAMGCVIQLALTRLRGADASGAAELFADGYNRAGVLNSRRGMAVCLLAMAIVARQLGNEADSAEWHREALALAEEERNPRLIAECLARCGDLALDRGEVDKAEELYRRCLDILSHLTDMELRAQVLRQLGRCGADRGSYGDTVEALMAAADEFAGLAQDEGELACVVRLAWALPRMGRVHSARRAMRRAGELATGRRATPSVVVGLLLAAEEALAGGDTEAAGTFAEDARNAARTIGDRTLVADSSRVLAAVASRQSKLDHACSLLESSLEITRIQNDRIVAMHLHRELGLARSAESDGQSARRHFAESAGLAAGLGEDASLDAANLLRDGGSGDQTVDVIAAADDDLAEIVWLRRLRAVDGETAFTEQVATYIGPSIDDVVRDLVPAFSGVAGVPAVVSPSTAVRVH